MSLYQDWIDAKQVEADAVEKRRQIEDELVKQLQLNEQDEGTKSFMDQGYELKVVQRHTQKIDAELLQEIANAEGLSNHLSTLFRWKPEVNKKLWDSADPSITRPLAEAITVKAGRPSFSITKGE